MRNGRSRVRFGVCEFIFFGTQNFDLRSNAIERVHIALPVVVMLSSNSNAIKRFTYDWLIRFAELHPVEVPDYNNFMDQFLDGPYSPLCSKYAAISPVFTTLITQHMPYMFHKHLTEIVKGKIANVDVPLTHKYKIYACTECHIMRPTAPGMLGWLETNRVVIYSQLIATMFDDLSDHILTVHELKYLLKFGPRDRFFHVRGVLTEPFKFSELWPLLQHCKETRIDLKNLIYDDNIATVLRENQVFPNEVWLCGLNVSDKAVLEIVDYFLALPKFPELLLFKFLQFKPVSLREAIITKLVSIGFKNHSKLSPEVPFRTICIWVEDSRVSCRFTHAY
uniref:F-box domain-containing protein n=1 Tax=Panagrellus redivivus TaxID=6233 RepID=A0A7E4VM67_PANRE